MPAFNKETDVYRGSHILLIFPNARLGVLRVGKHPVAKNISNRILTSTNLSVAGHVNRILDPIHDIK